MRKESNNVIRKGHYVPNYPVWKYEARRRWPDAKEVKGNAPWAIVTGPKRSNSPNKRTVSLFWDPLKAQADIRDIEAGERSGAVHGEMTCLYDVEFLSTEIRPHLHHWGF